MAKQKTVKRKVTKQQKTNTAKSIKYDVYDFRFDDVKKHCDSLETNEEKLIYLEYAKKEKLNKEDNFDLETYFSGPKFTKKVENEIKFIKSKMKIENAKKSELETDESNIELLWWKGTEGQLIYLYEQLVKNNLIDSSQDDRKYVLLSKHFKNKKGETYANKQMGQAAQNLVANKNRKPRKTEQIENIIEQTTKQK